MFYVLSAGDITATEQVGRSCRKVDVELIRKIFTNDPSCPLMKYV